MLFANDPSTTTKIWLRATIRYKARLGLVDGGVVEEMSVRGRGGGIRIASDCRRRTESPIPEIINASKQYGCLLSITYVCVRIVSLALF